MEVPNISPSNYECIWKKQKKEYSFKEKVEESVLVLPVHLHPNPIDDSSYSIGYLSSQLNTTSAYPWLQCSDVINAD
eukprot:9735249-Ditylum_brightwellii.AAC.1